MVDIKVQLFLYTFNNMEKVSIYNDLTVISLKFIVASLYWLLSDLQ